MDTFHAGAIRIDALLDGVIDHPFADAFPGCDELHFCTHGGVTGGRIAYRLTTYVVRAAGRVVVVDTGLGPTLSPLDRWGYEGTFGLLPRALDEMGLAPADVDAVVLTHLHPDHIGWNLTADEPRQPMFANAQYLVSRPEWDFWGPTSSKLVARHVRPLEATGQLCIVDDGHEAAPGVSLLVTPGHTPGHACVLVMDGGEGTLITGDAAHHPTELEDTTIFAAADQDQQRAADSRQAIATRAAAEGLLVLGGHFPAPGAGHLLPVERGRAWRWRGV